MYEQILKAIEDLKEEIRNNGELTRAVYTTKELAEVLGVNKRTVENMIAQGEIKCVRLGRAIRIPKQYVNEFLGGKTNESN